MTDIRCCFPQVCRNILYSLILVNWSNGCYFVVIANIGSSVSIKNPVGIHSVAPNACMPIYMAVYSHLDHNIFCFPGIMSSWCSCILLWVWATSLLLIAIYQCHYTWSLNQ